MHYGDAVVGWVYFREIIVELQWTVEISRILYSSARRATCFRLLSPHRGPSDWGLEPVIGATAGDNLSAMTMRDEDDQGERMCI
jgi:hypothetical protein